MSRDRHATNRWRAEARTAKECTRVGGCNNLVRKDAMCGRAIVVEERCGQGWREGCGGSEGENRCDGGSVVKDLDVYKSYTIVSILILLV